MKGKGVIISAEKLMKEHEAREKERRSRNPNYQTTFALR